jgi:hypothetical protein
MNVIIHKLNSPLWKIYPSLLSQNSCELMVLYWSLRKLLLHQADVAPECSHARAVPVCVGPLTGLDPQSTGINLQITQFQLLQNYNTNGSGVTSSCKLEILFVVWQGLT